MSGGILIKIANLDAAESFLRDAVGASNIKPRYNLAHRDLVNLLAWYGVASNMPPTVLHPNPQETGDE